MVDLPDTQPAELSGGMRRRVGFARAIALEPEILLFDEPTTALDVTTQIDVLMAIKEAIRDTGVAAIYITHDLAVVAQVSDHIMVLQNGSMVEYGETDQIINAPQEEYTKALVSVRSIRHEAGPGVVAEVQLTGETFEIDQAAGQRRSRQSGTPRIAGPLQSAADLLARAGPGALARPGAGGLLALAATVVLALLLWFNRPTPESNANETAAAGNKGAEAAMAARMSATPRQRWCRPGPRLARWTASL